VTRRLTTQAPAAQFIDELLDRLGERTTNLLNDSAKRAAEARARQGTSPQVQDPPSRPPAPGSAASGGETSAPAKD